MSLRDEIIEILQPLELWEHEDEKYNSNCRDLDINLVINKVLDAAAESNRRSAKELGLNEIEIHYLNEDLDKLRDGS